MPPPSPVPSEAAALGHLQLAPCHISCPSILRYGPCNSASTDMQLGHHRQEGSSLQSRCSAEVTTSGSAVASASCEISLRHHGLLWPRPHTCLHTCPHTHLNMCLHPTEINMPFSPAQGLKHRPATKWVWPSGHIHQPVGSTPQPPATTRGASECLATHVCGMSEHLEEQWGGGEECKGPDPARSDIVPHRGQLQQEPALQRCWHATQLSWQPIRRGSTRQANAGSMYRTHSSRRYKQTLYSKN